MKGHPGFAMTLLSIIHNQTRAHSLGLQQAAALYFKNLVKEGWERVRCLRRGWWARLHAVGREGTATDAH